MSDALGSRLAAARERLPAPPIQAAIGVAAIVVVATLGWGWMVRGVENWTVMTDELGVVLLAQSVWENVSPVPMLRGGDYELLNQLYPILLSPLWGALGTPDAFDLSHLLNAALMASAAVPAYLLTRSVIESRAAGLLVAALAVVVPWMALASILRAEVVAYPVFLWAALAIQRALVEPGVGRDLVALAAIAIAVFARTQFLILAVAFPLVVLLHEAGYALVERGEGAGRALLDGLRRAVRGHVVLAVLVAIAGPLALFGVLDPILGAYQGTLSTGSLLPAGTADRGFEHLAIITVAIGIVPTVLALAWGAVTIVRPQTRREHSFTALAAVVIVLMTVQASSFVIRFAGPDPQDRYFFYIAPLLLVGMVACVLDRRRLWPAIAASGVVVALLATAADYLPSKGPFHASPAKAFYSVLDFRLEQVAGWLPLGSPIADGAMPWIVLALAAALALAVRFAPARWVLAALAAVLLVFGIAETRSAYRQTVATVIPDLGHPAGTKPVKDWIDRALPEGAEVAILPSQTAIVGTREPDHNALLTWHTEFWNERVDTVYVARGDPDYSPFENGQLVVDWRTGGVLEANRTPPPRYLVVSTSRVDFYPRGRVVARSPYGLELIDAGVPYRAAWATRGADREGWTMPGRPVRLRVYGPRRRGVRVRMQLEAPPGMAQRRRFRLRSDGERTSGRLLPRGGDELDADGKWAPQESTSVAVCMPAGEREATLAVEGSTALRDEPFLNENGAVVHRSGRRVGLRLTGIRVGGSCRP